MKKLLILLSTVLVSIGASLTYFYFEAAVRHSTTYIWDDLFKSGTHRILVIPLCLVISLMFFGIQHYLDPKSEKHESHGFGEAPTPTITNFSKIIFIGFFSLIAGASLGPEAILVPACLVIGAYAGTKLFKKDKEIVSLLSMVGFVALFAAFFDSFLAGMLGLLLVTKQVKVKINATLIVIAAIASLVTIYMLKLLSGSAYTKLPPTKWHVSLSGLLLLVALFIGGYIVTYLMKGSQKGFEMVHELFTKSNWWTRGFVAAIGLSILYLLGGPLVEFTGNESITPMLQQSVSLGVTGLVWILIVKIMAISWSHKLGYRGGMVFPSIFLASVLVSIAHLVFKDNGFTISLVASLAGILASNAKLKILF